VGTETPVGATAPNDRERLEPITLVARVILADYTYISSVAFVSKFTHPLEHLIVSISPHLKVEMLLTPPLLLALTAVPAVRAGQWTDFMPTVAGFFDSVRPEKAFSNSSLDLSPFQVGHLLIDRSGLHRLAARQYCDAGKKRCVNGCIPNNGNCCSDGSECTAGNEMTT